MTKEDEVKSFKYLGKHFKGALKILLLFLVIAALMVVPLVIVKAYVYTKYNLPFPPSPEYQKSVLIKDCEPREDPDSSFPFKIIRDCYEVEIHPKVCQDGASDSYYLNEFHSFTYKIRDGGEYCEFYKKRYGVYHPKPVCLIPKSYDAVTFEDGVFISQGVVIGVECIEPTKTESFLFKWFVGN